MAANQPPADASYRINCKKLHLTLSALAIGEVSNEAFLGMARSKGDLLEYSIGEEVHPTPADATRPRHKHAYLKYANAINARDSRYMTTFDMQGVNGRVLHPHIQAVGSGVKDRQRVINYTQKDKEYIASPHLMNFDAEATDKGWAVEMNQATSVYAGMRTLQSKYPQTYYMYGERIEKGLKRRLGVATKVRYALTDFTCAALDLTKAVVLHGESNIGKTEFALAHFERPLLITRIDDLKKITDQTDGLVFDQMRFIHPEAPRKLNLTPDEVINLLDLAHTRSIPARYGDSTIPEGLPRIFTTNRRVPMREPIFAFGENHAEQQGIDRRVTYVGWLSDDLRRLP